MDYNKRQLYGKLNRREMLVAFGVTGLSTVSPGAVKEFSAFFYSNVAEMKRDLRLKEGDTVRTAGFYRAGDGGDAMYVIVSDETLTIDEGSCISLANKLVAVLTNVRAVNYAMFGAIGDGKHDDGRKIKAAHAYANTVEVPVVNLHGNFYLGETKDILIQTNVDWGATKFHIDERYNTREPLFRVTSKLRPIPVKLTGDEKRAFLSSLKPGVSSIPQLAPYSNCLIVITDSNDRIGFRAGSSYRGKVSRMREELFYVEEHGRIIGDIAWTFADYTFFVAYPLDDTYLTIQGGSFYVSGSDSGDRTVSYVKNGFYIRRSRTIIRNQWVGLDKGSRDSSMVARSGFYTFSTVYDCLLENIRLVPWEKERGTKDASVSQGTYGLSGNRMLNVVFRNVTAEGSLVHWGVFGTNMNKNFRIEQCKVNRVDVHFHCWNLFIKDSDIGYRGITVTGGGNLTVENTTCRNSRFINFRYDYGAKWDGAIYIRNCRLAPVRSAIAAILSFVSANFDYRYPIGYARRIKIEDFVVDYTEVGDKNNPCWIMQTSSYRPSLQRPLFFPEFSEIRNITVEGGSKGVRLLHVPGLQGFISTKEGRYDGIQIVPNAQMLFENIALEYGISDKEERKWHFMLASTDGAHDEPQLFPHIIFRNCQNFSGHFGGNVAKVVFEDCTINELHAGDKQRLRGSFNFSRCTFKPVAETADRIFELSTTLGTNFQNCLLLAPEIEGRSRPDLLHLVEAVTLNKEVKYNHVNTQLGNDILNYCQRLNIKLRPTFIAMLKSHHELESVWVDDLEHTMGRV